MAQQASLSSIPQDPHGGRRAMTPSTTHTHTRTHNIHKAYTTHHTHNIYNTSHTQYTQHITHTYNIYNTSHTHAQHT